MIGLYILIGFILLIFLFNGFKAKNFNKINNEMDELTIKKKEVLKEKVQNDLKNNKIDHVFVSTHSKKYHSKKCRYYNDTMLELPLDIAKKEGYVPCRICLHKKYISA